MITPPIFIDDTYIKPCKIAGKTSIKTGKFNEYYKTEECENLGLTLVSSNINFIYDKYDALLSAFP